VSFSFLLYKKIQNGGLSAVVLFGVGC